MRIAQILQKKGSKVATISSTATIAELLRAMAEHNIGAMIVADERGGLLGIVSERDVVRHLDQRGASLLTTAVSQIMTSDVITCTPEDTVEHLTEVMTHRRIRHLPVLSDGTLTGIISIGDVVKSRIDTLEHTQEQLESYIVQG